ncbi:MAG TPA: hypothetical protein IAD24_06225 [Candidatus Aphodomorpha intestinavium]|uniref:Uncharacterized protein n=1 Tax=Candidatus Aphodomorpha intestinavium TaxID=2840672 RepID=A0A9D1N454_9FIRM|nr:hypothetical protein [Candidatus Aphodomorpha intestinavium]
MIMQNMPYMLTAHYMAMAMRDIRFPITKRALIERAGERMIRTGPDAYTPFREILEKLPLDSFSCAAEFYSCHSAS